MIKFLILSICISSVGCVLKSPCESDEARQPWRDSWKAYPSAKSGDINALRQLFVATKAQLELPCVNAGEDSEAIREHIYSVLETIQDDKFYEALAREPWRIRSSVRKFLSLDKIRSGFPKTYEILRHSPDIKWPSDIAEENSLQDLSETERD